MSHRGSDARTASNRSEMAQLVRFVSSRFFLLLSSSLAMQMQAAPLQSSHRSQACRAAAPHHPCPWSMAWGPGVGGSSCLGSTGLAEIDLLFLEGCLGLPLMMSAEVMRSWPRPLGSALCLETLPCIKQAALDWVVVVQRGEMLGTLRRCRAVTVCHVCCNLKEGGEEGPLPRRLGHLRGPGCLACCVQSAKPLRWGGPGPVAREAFGIGGCAIRQAKRNGPGQGRLLMRCDIPLGEDGRCRGTGNECPPSSAGAAARVIRGAGARRSDP